LIYFAWKFLLTWVFDQPDERETGGLYFPLAMKFLFVGLYIEQFCLAALFFLKSSSGHSFLVQGILMVVLLVITIGAQTFLSAAFDPLSNYLPMSLATKKVQAKIERHWRKEVGLEKKGDNEAFDLFDRQHIRSIVRKRLNAAKAAEAGISAEISFLKPVIKDTFETIKEASTHRDAGHGHSQQDLHPTISRESHRSGSSRRSRSLSGSRHSHKSNRSVVATAAVAPAMKHDDPDSSGDEDDFDENGFRHPSSFAEQPWIWIPRDELGLSKYLVEELRMAGVDASDEGSMMDSEGDVEVTRSPPDEAWAGGFNA